MHDVPNVGLVDTHAERDRGHHDVQIVLQKLVLFGLPFAVAFCVVALVDPYNYFRLPSPVDDALKSRISFKLNYAMWKMFDYRRDPRPDILLERELDQVTPGAGGG